MTHGFALKMANANECDDHYHCYSSIHSCHIRSSNIIQPLIVTGGTALLRWLTVNSVTMALVQTISTRIMLLLSSSLTFYFTFQVTWSVSEPCLLAWVSEIFQQSHINVMRVVKKKHLCTLYHA